MLNLTYQIGLAFLVLFAATWANAADIELETLIKRGELEFPLYATSAGKERGIFIVEQKGKIYEFKDGEKKLFFELKRKEFESGNEKGLLSVAFHPNFSNKSSKHRGRFFINYTARYLAKKLPPGIPKESVDLKKPQLHTVIEEYRVSPEGSFSEGKVIFEEFQPFANHNGGLLKFGPDGFLYVGMGDGGAGGDPFKLARNTESLLGKMLRLDINSGKTYAIPKDNPFANVTKFRDEIYALGLRNPWRYSFDRKTGELFLADVGQGDFEEINIIKKGEDYGWSAMEGDHVFPPKAEHKPIGVLPIYTYDRRKLDRSSITGGYVYRGKKIPSLQGVYVYADYFEGNIWGLKKEDKKWKSIDLMTLPFGVNIASFAEDADGEILVLSHAEGALYRIVKK